MFSTEQRRKLELLKQEFGLSTYEALYILLQVEQNELLRLIADRLVGTSAQVPLQNLSPQDFSKASETISQIIHTVFKGVESFQSQFKNQPTRNSTESQ